MKATSFLIVEDQLETANFLSSLVKRIYPNAEVTLRHSVTAAREWLSTNKPEITLIDIGMPDDTGLNFLQEIKSADQKIIAIIVTAFRDDETIFQALSRGANGYILKEEEEESIFNILSRVKSGEPPLSPSIAHRLLNFFRQQSNETTELSPRETETLKLVAKGYTVPEVATELGLSRQTVAGYVKRIYQKLHISSRAEATEVAIRRGYI